jgi:serine/threonine protein kinase
MGCCFSSSEEKTQDYWEQFLENDHLEKASLPGGRHYGGGNGGGGGGDGSRSRGYERPVHRRAYESFDASAGGSAHSSSSSSSSDRSGGGGGGSEPLRGSFSMHVDIDFFERRYTMRQLLGRGKSADVYLVVENATGAEHACKVMRKEDVCPPHCGCEMHVKVREEVAALQRLDHPHIMRMVEVLETTSTIYIVTELLRGRELFDAIAARATTAKQQAKQAKQAATAAAAAAAAAAEGGGGSGGGGGGGGGGSGGSARRRASSSSSLPASFTEAEAADVVRRLAQALCYMHANGVAHRDLKPENIMFGDADENMNSLKIIDFGFSKSFQAGGGGGGRSGGRGGGGGGRGGGGGPGGGARRPVKRMATMLGTKGYIAPEVLSGQPYDKAVDCWSLGIVTYVLLLSRSYFELVTELPTRCRPSHFPTCCCDQPGTRCCAATCPSARTTTTWRRR